MAFLTSIAPDGFISGTYCPLPNFSADSARIKKGLTWFLKKRTDIKSKNKEGIVIHKPKILAEEFRILDLRTMN